MDQNIKRLLDYVVMYGGSIVGFEKLPEFEKKNADASNRVCTIQFDETNYFKYAWVPNFSDFHDTERNLSKFQSFYPLEKSIEFKMSQELIKLYKDQKQDREETPLTERPVLSHRAQSFFDAHKDMPGIKRTPDNSKK